MKCVQTERQKKIIRQANSNVLLLFQNFDFLD